MVCLPCCIYPVMAFLATLYYRFLHPIIEPILTKIWRERILGEVPATQPSQSNENKTAKSLASGSFGSSCPFKTVATGDQQSDEDKKES